MTHFDYLDKDMPKITLLGLKVYVPLIRHGTTLTRFYSRGKYNYEYRQNVFLPYNRDADTDASVSELANLLNSLKLSTPR